MDTKDDIDEPIPEVWEMFLRLISDNDREYKFLHKIMNKQISKIVNNIKNMYEGDQLQKGARDVVPEQLEEQEDSAIYVVY